jgi:Response regulators consisting of a CheY-like receiver domain and a winged-helix DNA-binding domain
VIEDDFKSADLIRVLLEAEGFKVLHAETGEAAEILAERQPLSLIILDIMLPKMDGWEFLARRQRMPALCNVPVVNRVDRCRSQQGLRARRIGGNAEADFAAGAVRHLNSLGSFPSSPATG